MSETTNTTPTEVTARLAYLLDQINKERISYFELFELQTMGDAGLIPDNEIVLREWAGLPEFEESD